MRFGICGLGRMGESLALQAIDHGHEVVGFDPQGSEALEAAGGRVVDSVDALAKALAPPRVALVYVPHGDPTEEVLSQLEQAFERDDVVVDGGNTHWDESIRRHGEFAERGIRFLDAGTSGGVTGARNGACFMVGGDADAYALVEELLVDLAVPEGALYVGATGSGHFVKNVHNMIEFGMVQAIGEGVELLKTGDWDIDLADLFHNWNHGSVIRSWLVELMERALRSEHHMEDLDPYIEDTGEQRWGVQYALDKELPIPLLAQAVWGFYESRDEGRPWAKSVALLRHEYGGHPLRTKARKDA
ncbi:MAG: decarboxylating 6-phosphogluconate dehydrogenase [Actinomycetota bacterium]|nr:decarboxylating 6-phosphogluconate dehydrogenase [Actinomycetota bacterium]